MESKALYKRIFGLWKSFWDTESLGQKTSIPQWWPSIPDEEPGVNQSVPCASKSISVVVYCMLDDIATLLCVPSKSILITLTPKRKWKKKKSLTTRELKEISFPVSFIYFCLYFFSAWKSFHLWGGSKQWIKQWLSVGFKACTTPKLNTCLCIFPKCWAQYLLERYLIATF